MDQSGVIEKTFTLHVWPN